jgi:hypothetical protein
VEVNRHGSRSGNPEPSRGTFVLLQNNNTGPWRGLTATKITRQSVSVPNGPPARHVS